MKDDLWKNRIQAYLDGELSAEEERDALHQIADDPELRALMKLDRLLYQGLGKHKMGSPEVPDDFTDRVMAAVFDKSVERQPKQRFVDNLIQWLDHLLNPQWIQWRPVYSMAIASMVLLLLLIPPLLHQKTTIPPLKNHVANHATANIQQVSTSTSSMVWMRFVYVANKAHSVAVAGDFNDWNPIPMTKSTENGQTVWSITIPLPHKEIHYMFVCNGDKWIPDPLAPRQENDGFGHRNSVISL